MTSSIPTFLPETIAPSGGPVAVPGPLAAVPNVVPDFAGLLVDAAPASGRVAVPEVTPVPAGAAASPADAVDVILLPAPGIVAILIGASAQPPACAGLVRRYVPTPGGVERAGEATIVSESDAPAAPVAPTRAEQEEAMAMLAACFPSLPEGVLSPPITLAPAPTENGPSAPVCPGGTAGPAMPGWRDEPRPADMVGWPERAGVTGEDRTDPMDPTARSGGLVGAERPAAWRGKAEFAPLVIAESPGALRGNVPAAPSRRQSPDGPAATMAEDAASANESTLGFAKPPAVPTARPGPDDWSGTGVSPDRPPVPENAVLAGEALVIEASVVRPDGVRLARRTAAIVAGPPRLFPLVEKSAGTPVDAATSVPFENEGSEKKLLSITGHKLEEDMPDDGTTAANAGANMNPREPQSFVTPAQGLGMGVRLPEARFPSVDVPAGREAAERAAPRVISTVLEVVEAQEASKLRPVPAVHLRMQVAGETIGIKVELRDATVLTHFTVVSSGLREALAREWQAAQAEVPAGAPRLQDPVFNANPDRGGSGSPGQDAASQQQSQARTGNFPWEQPTLPGSRRPRPAAAAAAVPGDPAVDVPLLSAVA